MSSNKTPFELRFEMFKEAKSILSEQYYSEREDALTKFNGEIEVGLNPVFPEPPSYPTFNDFEDMAHRINTFVSSSN